MEREAGISGEMGVRVESMLSGGCLQQYREAGDELGWVGLIKWWKNRSPQDVTDRLDRLIEDIRLRYHSKAIGTPEGQHASGDVLLVAHGHILRAFAMRWVKHSLTEGVHLLLEGMLSRVR